MDSKDLCDFCDPINFGAVGFCGSDLDFSILRSQNITLVKILQNPKQCFFCGKIAEFFHDWRRLRKFPEQALDLEKSLAFVSLVFLKSLEIDDKGKPKGHLICIDVRLDVKGNDAISSASTSFCMSKEMMPSLPSAALFRPVLQFRKCSQHPLTVTDICDGGSLFDWESGQDQQAYSGRIRPLVADTRLFRKWKESCCAMHDGHCNSIFTGSLPRRLRVIDVEKRCVVDNEDGSSYVALSYVWGEGELKKHSKQMPKLTKLTEDDFRKPESLTRKKVLSTIDDAIEVTRSLGEKYIWVDCLCILQKDGVDNNQQEIEADLREFIPQMDSIYGFASVTIVAASGDHADAGLPGIKRHSRTREQIPFTIKGVSLLATLDPIKEFNAINTSYLGESVWNKRGWTFQENLFSERALIFTSEQVYWECQKASWCEDSLRETMISPIIYRHSLAGEEFRHPWGTDVDSFDKILYGMLVREYSARALSFECDGLDAFAGILHHLERQAGQSFLCALPVSLLSVALTWWPLTSPGRRRSRILEDGMTTLCPFPSWSWVGWVGKIDYSIFIDYGCLNSKTIGLIFYHLDDTGLLKIVQEAAATQSLSQISIRKDDDTIIVTLEDIPESIRVPSRSKPSNVLCFWSSAAILPVRHDVNAQQLTLSHNGEIVPVVWFHMPLLNPDHEELFEFVVVESVNFDVDGDCLALLLVSWEDGIAYRQGLVKIEFSDWAELDNRVWKLIFLG